MAFVVAGASRRRIVGALGWSHAAERMFVLEVEFPAAPEEGWKGEVSWMVLAPCLD
jgi:hypothetical protein